MNLLQRTCPTKMDKYQSNYIGALPSAAINNPINGFSDALNVDEVGNGAWPGFQWTKANGVPLAQSGADLFTTTAAGAPVTIYSVNGVPVVSTGAVAGPIFLYFSLTSTEKLTLSPFVFADDHEHDTGLNEWSCAAGAA
jgi:hypothetical protein